MAEREARIALVAGASGMVGTQLLAVLLDSPEYVRVHALSRRPLSIDHPRLANRIVRFETLEEQLRGATYDDAFCCLGTTMRQAGSPSAFRAVDHDLVVSFARAALASGAERFVLLSSVGANPEAKNLYLRVKGETELALEALRFRSLDILQPSLLLGSRRESRPLERLAQVALALANPLLHGRYTMWRAIPASTVAAAMCGAARSGRRGVYRYQYAGIQQMAKLASRNSTRM
jgi:uncharacterized protein YbjT (DUF2867 family)